VRTQDRQLERLQTRADAELLARYSDTAPLLPAFEWRLQELISDARQEGHNLHIFETWRTPERQRQLLLRRPKATSADAWGSGHQFLGSADVVKQTENGRWTWDDKTFYFRKLPELVERHGLEQLRRADGKLIESVHVQLMPCPHNVDDALHLLQEGKATPEWCRATLERFCPHGAPSWWVRALREIAACRP
jgi:hypothetical protein